MQTAVREPVAGPSGIGPVSGSGAAVDDPASVHPDRHLSGRVYTVRSDGRPAFEGSFGDAYTWAVSRGEGLVTLTSLSAAASERAA